MDTILDITKVFLSSICFRLLLTDVACEIFFLYLCCLIALAYIFGKMAPVTAIMGAISL